MNLQEQISRIQSMMGVINENTNKFDFIEGEIKLKKPNTIGC